MTLSPFRIDVSDEVLDDLRSRLTRTRFTTRTDNQPWRAGADPDYLRDLVSYWADEFDWRTRETELNALPHYQAQIGGRRAHFLHVPAVRAAGATPLPLILCHGWPSSFVEMLPLVERLTDPTRYGGDPADAFDVVVPSLPGFLYSELPDVPLTRAAIAEILHQLMTGVLGYERYGAFGGDIGGAATAWLGARYPDNVVGIHLIHPPFPSSFDNRPLSPAEQAYLDAEAAYDETDGGYSSIMATRPDTIAAALLDSPVGLAAWLIDKYRDWTDNRGDLEHSIDRDTLLTIITLYWTSGAIGSSFRQYYDFTHNSPRPTITVPVGITLSCEPVVVDFPREIAERACTDIRHWSEPGRGGHFMPLEEPELLAGELRQFFASLRPY
ncbi:MAG TPA: epoxide hydrolase [Jatrophihabitantaceae bacterium]